MPCCIIVEQAWQPVFSRSTDLADSIMTAIVLAPFAPAATLFIDLGRLRVQECERVEALRTELTKCGAHVKEIRDSLRINPGPLHGAEIETYGDHRVAMCFGMLGLRVPGIRLRNPACVRKTFPKVYHMNVIMVWRADAAPEKPIFHRVRVVFDKNDIQYIAQILNT